jgi:hypothetical protein
MTRLLAALAVVSTVLFATPAFAVIQRCLPNPLPPPTAPVFSRDVQRFSEQMHLDVWRVPCDGSFALLMKVTPLSMGPFLCESDFSILQGGAPFEFALADAFAPAFCAPLLAPQTFSLVPKQPAYNIAAPLTILFDTLSGMSRFATLEVAAAVPPPTVTVLALGCTTCQPGDTLSFVVRIDNPDGLTVVELKTGARLPDGSVVTILGRFVQKALGAGVSETISLFPSFVLQAGAFPAGAYTIEAALLEPDLGVTISRHSVTLTLLP